MIDSTASAFPGLADDDGLDAEFAALRARAEGLSVRAPSPQTGGSDEHPEEQHLRQHAFRIVELQKSPQSVREKAIQAYTKVRDLLDVQSEPTGFHLSHAA